MELKLRLIRRLLKWYHKKFYKKKHGEAWYLIGGTIELLDQDIRDNWRRDV